MSHARDTTLTLFVISPEAEIILILVHSIFDTLSYILVMFGRNEEEDQ